MAPSSVFLTFLWEISDDIIILRFCNIVEGQAKYYQNVSKAGDHCKCTNDQCLNVLQGNVPLMAPVKWRNSVYDWFDGDLPSKKYINEWSPILALLCLLASFSTYSSDNIFPLIFEYSQRR